MGDRVVYVAVSGGSSESGSPKNQLLRAIAGCFRWADIPQPRTDLRPLLRTTPPASPTTAGPRGDLPIVLIHAGVTDRRIWDPLWSRLTAERDVVRLDLRGFGESATRARGVLSPVVDVLGTLTEVDIDRCHFVGASFGAGVAVEVALTRPK